MNAKKVRNILAAALVTGAVALTGCGGGNVSAVQQNDSVIQSVTDVTESVPEATSDAAGTDSAVDVITPQVIQPNAILPEESTESTAESQAESTAESQEVETESVGYTTAGINLRSEASSDGDVVNTIEAGEQLTILGSTDGEWTHVRYDGEEGYIASKYVTTDSSVAEDARRSYYDDDDDDEEYDRYDEDDE